MIGVAISAISLFVAFAVLPFVRHWSAREQLIAGQSDRLERTRQLIRNEPLMRRKLEAQRLSADATSQRLLSARTPALAASALQSVLQSFADQSQMTVSQLDVTGPPDSTSSFIAIPAVISAIGEIESVTHMLSLIQHGPLLLHLHEMTIRPNPALKGDLLQMTVTLRAPYSAQATDSQTMIALEGIRVDPAFNAPLIANNVFTAKRAEIMAAEPRVALPRARVEGPLLYGTMLGSQPSALMRLDPGVDGAQVYREGDTGGSYRVIKINERSVVLSGPSGRVVLHLVNPDGQTP